MILLFSQWAQKIVYVAGLAVILTVFVACTGDDSEPDDLEELPTLISLDNLTVAPSESLLPTADEPQQTPLQPTADPTTSEIPPSSEATAETTIDPFSNDAPTGSGNPTFSEDETVNFETLMIGDSVSIHGALRVDLDSQKSFIKDDNENQIEIIIPLSLTESYDGQTVMVTGEIQEGDAGALTILPELFNVLTTPERGDPTQNGNDEILPFLGAEATEDTTADIDLPFDTSETLDFTLEANLTALQTYDALIEQLGDDIAELGWLGMSGNSDVGWLIQFYDTDNNQTVTYSIDPEGAVMVSPPELVPLLPNQEIFLIDRDNVVMDSDSVMDQIGTEVVSPFGLPVLNLTAPSLDRIEWIVQANDEIIIDATR